MSLAIWALAWLTDCSAALWSLAIWASAWHDALSGLVTVARLLSTRLGHALLSLLLRRVVSSLGVGDGLLVLGDSHLVARNAVLCLRHRLVGLGGGEVGLGAVEIGFRLLEVAFQRRRLQGGQLGAGLHRFPGRHFDAVHGPGDGEVDVGLGGRLDSARG